MPAYHSWGNFTSARLCDAKKILVKKILKKKKKNWSEKKNWKKKIWEKKNWGGKIFLGKKIGGGKCWGPNLTSDSTLTLKPKFKLNIVTEIWTSWCRIWPQVCHPPNAGGWCVLFGAKRSILYLLLLIYCSKINIGFILVDTYTYIKPIFIT